MSKEKTLRTSEETEVMQATGVPAQETEEVSAALATEIIADLKKQLEEAKKRRKIGRKVKTELCLFAVIGIRTLSMILPSSFIQATTTYLFGFLAQEKS